MGPTKNCGDVSFWENRYDENNIGWHIEEINSVLVDNLPLLVKDEGGAASSSKKFFIPLCGKTKDIPYLLSLGHRVFALEAVLQPILDLDAEHSFGLTFDKESSIYSTQDGRLQIYHGDLFKCPIENYGPFDCVWDRGSFCALAYSQREDYVSVMKRGLRNSKQGYHQFRYLLSVVCYDRNAFEGPPNSVEAEDLSKYYGNWTIFEEVENQLISDDNIFNRVSGRLPQGTATVSYLLTPK